MKKKKTSSKLYSRHYLLKPFFAYDILVNLFVLNIMRLQSLTFKYTILKNSTLNSTNLGQIE